MANIPIRTFEELPSTPRTTMADNEGNIYIADQMLVESRIIENVQAIEVVHLLEE